MKCRASLFAAVLALGGPAQAPRLLRVYPLKPQEGVFAYARISPDGRRLVYASEMPDPKRFGSITQTVTVVELASRRILFTEPGIDAYWSPDGTRMIYQSFKDHQPSVNIRESDGRISSRIAPLELGDYYSWGSRGGKDLILTINSRYYYLDGSRAVLPAAAVQPCPGIGAGERPLLSKDGRLITTFVRGNILVRDLTDCGNIFDTGIQGAKADFSWDGRYIAFHAPKANGKGYEIDVVDLRAHTLRVITHLPGSSLFPSWTQDGRLCFRYDGDDYRGFMIATNVLSAPARPLPVTRDHTSLGRAWSEIFPETPIPAHRLNLVLIWGTWSAHSPNALADLQRAQDHFTREHADIGVMMATESGSRPPDIARMLGEQHIVVRRIPLAPGRLSLTEAENQNPTTVLFQDGRVVDRRFGAQTFDQLRDWVTKYQ